MIRAVIIDDEPESRTVVSNILTNFCKDVTVLGEATDVASGIQIIEAYRPDVVFLDIEMPDGNGFELLENISDISFHVIFVTAFEQYAIRAIKFSAIDYLLKPIDPQQLLGAVEKVRNLSPRKIQSPERISTLLNNKQKITRIALPTLSGYFFVKIREIVRCEADDNYTYFFMNSGGKFLVTRTLKEYELLLSGESFVRVHQSHLINLDFVVRYIKGEGGTVVMDDGSEVEISRRKRELFLKRMLLQKDQ
ncbi:MAG: LytTR family DNA-binding domain-containing protein [Bacteroidales bacterium]|nr:LytTR family DNA-binding domain-containing protein [Bacteroidales bacterium]